MVNNLDEFIKESVKAIITKPLPHEDEYPNTDNLAEVIEKLIILHIRVWNMENACYEADVETLASLKRKIDICFKSKRPKYLEAINRIIQDFVIFNKEIYEQSVKHYNGFN